MRSGDVAADCAHLRQNKAAQAQRVSGTMRRHHHSVRGWQGTRRHGIAPLARARHRAIRVPGCAVMATQSQTQQQPTGDDCQGAQQLSSPRAGAA